MSDKMSAYGQYIKERENFDILEDERGFATYQVNGAQCYIRDIFVLPGFRKENVATSYAKEIESRAKAAGCTQIIGTVSPLAKFSTDSVKVLFAYGFRVATCHENQIVFIKDI